MKKLFVMVAVMLGVGFVSTLYANEGWLTDFEKAKVEAKKSNKLIFIDFSGSDWCGACIALEKKVLTQDAFKKFAKENFVLLSIDFPKYKKLPNSLARQNGMLAQKYRVQYFPTVILLDSTGKELKRVDYMGENAEGYVEKLKKLINK